MQKLQHLDKCTPYTPVQRSTPDTDSWTPEEWHMPGMTKGYVGTWQMAGGLDSCCSGQSLHSTTVLQYGQHWTWRESNNKMANYGSYSPFTVSMDLVVIILECQAWALAPTVYIGRGSFSSQQGVSNLCSGFGQIVTLKSNHQAQGKTSEEDHCGVEYKRVYCYASDDCFCREFVTLPWFSGFPPHQSG